MRAQPKNHRALCHAVRYVDSGEVEGGLTPADRNLLNCLAGYARSNRGEGAHPGNVNLCAAVGLKLSAMLRRVQILISKGLIERTAIGDGRKNSSVYQICWWHDAYPDCAPGGGKESFIADEQHSESEAGNIPNAGGKHSEALAATFRSDVGNIPNEARKHSAPDSEYNKRTTESQQTIQPNPAPIGAKGGWEAFVETPAAMPEEMEGQVVGKYKSDLELLVVASGTELLSEIMYLWVQRRDMPVTGIYSNRWKFFFEEYSARVFEAKQRLAAGFSSRKERLSETTVEGCAAKATERERTLRLLEEQVLRLGREEMAKNPPPEMEPGDELDEWLTARRSKTTAEFEAWRKSKGY